MPTLTAPYNFVPLTPHVVRPAWAGQISHDKPFSDGKSGTLKLTITAITPIFTRNNVSRRIINEAQRKEAGSHFSKLADQCFLPGSSIKGAIRNVLEIMSFGDLAAGLIDKPFAMRDLAIDSYKELFSGSGQVYCGWLKGNAKEGYIIEDCGFPHRITHQEIDNHFNSPILKNWAGGFETETQDNWRRFNIDKGLAMVKRQLFNGRNLTATYKLSHGQVVHGTLILTGQPSIKYDHNRRGTIEVNHGERIKYKEFIFGNAIATHKVEPTVIEAFEFAYQSLYGRQSLNEPVFFHKDEEGKVQSFGLAYMYKIPFKYSVRSAIERVQKKGGPDLAQCIFGHVESIALKGRVTFSHAYALDNFTQLQVRREVLNSPKPTYYPTYIKQEVNNSGKVPYVQGNYRYKTLFDRDATPSGWKRYPIHNPASANNGIETTAGNESLKTAFRPLPAGTTFTCQVQYHNLRTIELGALLSALTFHRMESCFHTLGMARPLGYGQCSIKVDGISTDDEKTAALKAYEAYMESQLQGINGGWAGSDSVRELLTMSTHQNNTEERSRLKYMDAVKDFAAAKKEGQALARYTKLPGIAPGIKTVTRLCSEAELNEARLSVLNMPVADTHSLQDVFNQQKLRLQDELAGLIKHKKEGADKLLKEQQAEAERQKKIAEAEESEKALKAKELSGGINLNGVSANKTVDALLRACKYWHEKVGGRFAEAEVNKIKVRLSEIYDGLKPKDKQAWIQTVTKDLLRLNVYLTPDQISEIE